MHTGEVKTEGGRVGEGSAVGISGTLTKLGFELGRLKTGTPPRLARATIDFDRTTPQPGDDDPRPFSFRTARLDVEQVHCHLTRTTEATHRVIRAHFELRDDVLFWAGETLVRVPAETAG